VEPDIERGVPLLFVLGGISTDSNASFASLGTKPPVQ
jgi:hypothetical protein